jgi:hypothetical protein
LALRFEPGRQSIKDLAGDASGWASVIVNGDGDAGGNTFLECCPRTTLSKAKSPNACEGSPGTCNAPSGRRSRKGTISN